VALEVPVILAYFSVVTVGILLCKRKHEALVEIALRKDANIHAREYQLYLPSKEDLQMKLAEWAEIDDESSV